MTGIKTPYLSVIIKFISTTINNKNHYTPKKEFILINIFLPHYYLSLKRQNRNRLLTKPRYTNNGNTQNSKKDYHTKE